MIPMTYQIRSVLVTACLAVALTVTCIATALSVLSGPAAAQATKAQQDAVRANCRSDFISLCRGVRPGGAEALGCLRQNSARLQPACKAAVDAIQPSGSAPRSAAPAASTVGAAPSSEPAIVVAQAEQAATMALAQLSPRQLRNLQLACAADAQIHCVGVPRDPQSRLACLRDNATWLSPPCKQALGAMAAAMPQAAPAAAAASGGQPTAAQQEAIRANCRGDAQSLCRGQQGQAALVCLQQNSSRLSPACRQAVSALGGASAPAGPAQAQPTAAQQNAIRSNCRGDAQSLCPGQQGQAALACLQQNSARLSPACRQAVGALGGSAPATAPAPAPARSAAPPATAPTPTAAPPQPTAEQQAAMRANCRNDAQGLCPGQQGQAAYRCLQQNAPKLSPACRAAVTGQSSASPASAPSAAKPPAAANAPAQPQPAPAAAAPAAGGAEAEQMATLGRACGVDIQTHCKGVSLGSGRVMACLAANGASLSAQCRQALSDVSRSR